MRLSILICHLPKRKQLLNRLITILNPQLDPFIEVIVNDDEFMSIGKKRNFLLNSARGKYIAFIDDDDFVSDNYINLLIGGINKGADCCSLTGEITEDGKNPLLFEHSIKYKEYKTVPDLPKDFFTYGAGAQHAWLVQNDGHFFGDKLVKYLRFPNHLNCIKASIAKQFKFPEKNHGEDTDWATQIFKSGLIKTEHYIPELLYYYDYRSKK